jgi:sugar O-acyltransferase (sialic acid O-acetyltransferase NeuD family)
MSRILIAGGGGFGLEMYSYITADLASKALSEPTLVGILNDNLDCEVLRKIPHAPYFGSIQEYQPAPNDEVIIAIGNPNARREIFTLLRARGTKLLTYIHPTALVAVTAIIGKGAIICPNSIVNADATIGDNVALNIFCSVGHGAKVGAHSVLSPYCSLNGDATLGEVGFMGSGATIFPKIQVGDNCTIDAHTAVRHSAPHNQMIAVRGQYLVVAQRPLPRRPTA